MTARGAKIPERKVIFAAPAPTARKLPSGTLATPEDLEKFDDIALAFQYRTLIYPEPDSAAGYIGTVRRGVHIGVEASTF